MSAREVDAVLCTSSAMAEYVFKSREISHQEKEVLLLMDFMDLDSDKWRQYARSGENLAFKWIYSRESRILAEYERKIRKSFDAGFFVSQSEIDLYIEKNGSSEKLHVLGNGIDRLSYKPAENKKYSEKKPVFLFTGVMDYKPNVDAILWFTRFVWPSVIEKYKDAQLIVAGMNPVKRIQDLQKDDGIEVTGYVDDILPYYHRSDYFVAPLRIARGIQNKILQAFACGLPVISTSMGAEGITYKNGSDILIADTPESFVECIDKLEQCSELKDSIRNNALNLVATEYSWCRQFETLDRLLDEFSSSQNIID